MLESSRGDMAVILTAKTMLQPLLTKSLRRASFATRAIQLKAMFL